VQGGAEAELLAHTGRGDVLARFRHRGVVAAAPWLGYRAALEGVLDLA
jgi:hypothetical protein